MFKASSGGVYRRVKATAGGPRTILSNLLRDGNTVANYQPGVGVTGALNASAWANQIGAAGALQQASGANQPIVLPYSGAKYVYLPAAASNTVTTPTKTITGNFTKTYDLAPNTYTPAADVTIDDKSSGNNGFTVKWLTTDKLRLVIGDGVGLTNFDATVASGLTAGTRHTIKIVYVDNATMDLSIDGVAWGTQVTVNKTLTNAAVSWTLGSTTSIGKVYDHTMTNSAGTTYYHLNPAASAETTTNAATWTSDNGEVYTLNNTGTRPAQIVASSQLLFDSTNNNYLATGALTLAQPEILYVVLNQLAWTANRGIFDGQTSNSMRLIQDKNGGSGALPNLVIYAGSYGPQDLTDGTLRAYHLVTALFNGASSSLQVDSNAAGTGNVGAGNAGGFIVGIDGGLTLPSNIQVKEIIIRKVADSAATQAQIQALLKAIHGTP